MASQTLSAPDFVAPRRHRRKRRPGAPRKFNHSKACALRAAGVPVSVIARKFKVSVLPIYLATAAERRPETFEGVDIPLYHRSVKATFCGAWLDNLNGAERV